MAAEQLQDLNLTEKQAKQIIELGMSFGAYEAGELPDSKKEKLSAATEIVASSLDAWVNDEIRPDDEEADVAEAGAQIAKVFEVAGITVDDDGEVSYGDEDEAEEDEDEEDPNEEPFDPDSYIEGYSDLSVVSKLKAVKKLDPDDDDDAAILQAIADWENEQEKPSSRILNYIDETLGEQEEDEDEAEEDDDQPEAEAEEDEADNGDDDEELAEPWDGYDKASAVQIKKVLKEASEDEDDPLTAEQVEYVLEYEQSREKPAPRKRIIDFGKALLEELANGGDKAEEEPEEEPEEQPKKKRGRPKKQAEQPKAEAGNNGSITLTREQILEALAEGEVTIAV